MINRDDPLIQSVEKIMKDTVIRRQIEESVNAEFGIQNRKQLTLEQVATYDALLEKRISEALHPSQQTLDMHEPEKDELTSQDFKMLRAKKTVKEKEQLDEISDRLRWIYGMRAKDDIWDIRSKHGMRDTNWNHENLPDEDKNIIRKRTAGLIRAAKKFTREEVEELDELSSETLTSYVKKATTSANRSVKLRDKRVPGIQLANKKLNKEEVEQLDEISKGKLADYIKAASHDVATKSAATGRYADRANRVSDEMKKGDYSNYTQGKKDNETANKMFDKSWKRRQGIAKAADKMVKEDHLDEAQTPQQKAAEAALKTQEGSYDRGKKGGAINRMALMKKKDLEKIAKGKSQEEKVEKIDEMAPPGAKYERMIKHIKSGYAKDGLTDKEKSIAYATAWKAKNKNEQ